jgi:hypothetical protein
VFVDDNEPVGIRVGGNEENPEGSVHSLVVFSLKSHNNRMWNKPPSFTMNVTIAMGNRGALGKGKRLGYSGSE